MLPLVVKDPLLLHYLAYKVFIVKDKLKVKNKQHFVLAKLQQEKDLKEIFKAIWRKWKLIQMDKNIKRYEQQAKELSNRQDCPFGIIF